MSADPTKKDVDWLRTLVASTDKLSSTDYAEINRLVVEGVGRLPSAKQLSDSLREKLFPKRQQPGYTPITWTRKIT